MSRRQLHELGGSGELLRKFATPVWPEHSARTCGMEARDEPQHRTKVKPRKAGLIWVSAPSSTTPEIQSRQDGNEDGSGGTLLRGGEDSMNP